nr:DUF2199 domain-containing protein [Defluviimonas salinarum]
MFGIGSGTTEPPGAERQSLQADARWRRLHDRNWTCPACDQVHNGVFDLAYARPDPYQGPEDYEPNGAVPDALAAGRDILTEDFCLLGPHRILRCVLPIPIIGSDTQFAFGVWGTIKPDHFDEVLEHFDSGTAADTGPYFSWLMNQLPGASRDPARCTMTMQNGRQRPMLAIDDESHPFHAAQRDGITFDALLDLYARYGHDIRPYLTDA